jgi:hypothetical protein
VEALCWLCHLYLDEHPSEHEEWKRQRLGEERFESLSRRAQQIMKVDLTAIRDQLELFSIKLRNEVV